MSQEIKKELKKGQETIKRPTYISLMKKYNCGNCKLNKNCYGEGAWDCIKRFGILKLLANVLAIGAIYYVFQKTLYMFSWPMLSIFLTAIAIGIMDFLFVGFGKAIQTFFIKLDNNRYQKFMKELEEYEQECKRQKEEEKRLKEEEQRKEEAKFAEVNEAKALVKQFYAISQLDNIEEKANPFKIKKYTNFSNILMQISNELVPESFGYLEMKHLFQIHLPEFLSICKDYAERYSEGTLLEKEKVNFDKLLDGFTDRLIKLQSDIKEGKGYDLNIRMKALSSLIKQNGSEQ